MEFVKFVVFFLHEPSTEREREGGREFINF